jgi:DNA-binding NarL/FixJ family response regulator
MSSNRAFYRGLPSFHAAVVGKKTINPSQVKYMLKSLGFRNCTTFQSHFSLLQTKESINRFTHILFDAREDDVALGDFVKSVLKQHPAAILVALTAAPRIDNVFELICRGARGFLVTPLNLDMVEEVLVRATDGSPFSETILQAEDRNHAFAEFVLNHLYRLAIAMHQSRENLMPPKALRVLEVHLHEAMEMARMFCEHDETHLRESIVEACIRRADDQKTKLGQLRKSLRARRAQQVDAT